MKWIKGFVLNAYNGVPGTNVLLAIAFLAFVLSLFSAAIWSGWGRPSSQLLPAGTYPLRSVTLWQNSPYGPPQAQVSVVNGQRTEHRRLPAVEIKRQEQNTNYLSVKSDGTAVAYLDKVFAAGKMSTVILTGLFLAEISFISIVLWVIMIVLLIFLGRRWGSEFEVERVPHG